MDDLSDLVWQSAGVRPPQTQAPTLANLSNRAASQPTQLSGALARSASPAPVLLQAQTSQSAFASPRSSPAFNGSYIPAYAAHSSTQRSSPERVNSPQKIPETSAQKPKNDDPFGSLVNFGQGGQKNQNLSLAEQVRLKQQQQQYQQRHPKPAATLDKLPSAADMMFLDALGKSSNIMTSTVIPLMTAQPQKMQSMPATLTPTKLPSAVTSPLLNTPPAVKPHASVAVSETSTDMWNFDAFATSQAQKPKQQDNDRATKSLIFDGATNSTSTDLLDIGLIAPSNHKVQQQSPQQLKGLPQTQQNSINEERIPETNVKMDELVSQMLDMGFDFDSSVKALKSTNGDLHRAIDVATKEKRTSPTSNYHDEDASDARPSSVTDRQNSNSLPMRYQDSSASEDEYTHYGQSKSTTPQDNFTKLGMSMLNKAGNLMNKSKQKVLSKVEEIKEKGGATAVLSSVVEAVQTKIDNVRSGARAEQTYGGYNPNFGETDASFTSYRDYEDNANVGDKPVLRGHADFNEISSVVDSRNTYSDIARPPISTTPAFIPTPEPPKQKISRPPFVQAEASAIDSVNTHKETGNEAYKRGQFAEAADSYSNAIACLPKNHLLLIALFNNRAAARLKTGEYKECIQDCDTVEAIVQYYGGFSTQPNNQDDEDNRIENKQLSILITIQDVIKSLLRKGTAFEAAEKYTDAKHIYSEIITLDIRNKIAREGFARSNKASIVTSNITSASITAQKTETIVSTKESTNSTQNDFLSLFESPAFQSNETTVKNSVFATSDMFAKTSTVSVDVNQSNAVKEMRQQEQMNERESEEKLRVKDDVDSKLESWKKSKEQNLRALLASLELVLWSDLNWQKCNLAELITPSQVKVRYMKAIAKVHPDKIPTSETVEHRLIANSVFSVLNEAWDAFKLQNNL